MPDLAMRHGRIDGLTDEPLLNKEKFCFSKEIKKRKYLSTGK